MAPTLLALLFAAGYASGAGIEPSAFFRITALHSGKCLDVTGGPDATGNGVGVIQWDCHGGDNQKWQLVPLGDNYFKILAKHSGKALSVFGGTISTGDGVAVQQQDYNGAANQIWKVVFDRGSFLISAKHSGMLLEIKGGPEARWNGAPAQQGADVSGGGLNQRWRLTQLPDVGDAGIDHVTGTFIYADTEAGRPGTFPRPIAGCRVQVWRAGALASTTETGVDGTFDAPVPHVPDGTDTTVVLYATNAAAQVLAGSGAFFVRVTRLTRGSAPLDFSTTFSTVEQVRSFNAAHDIRLAYNYASARRARGETEVIPRVDVSFMDHDVLLSHYNQPASGLLIHRNHAESDLVVMHEYAHFLEDKIGSFLLLPSFHDGCFMSQRCPNPAACTNLLINSPENAWMEGFANYFAMAVKRANPSERFNLDTRGGTMTEAELDLPAACGAVGRTAFDGHRIDGDMIEGFVASALWHISSGGDPARSEEAVFQIFDGELDGSATGVLPNIRLFHNAWTPRQRFNPALLGHPGLDDILRVNIPTVASHAP